MRILVRYWWVATLAVLAAVTAASLSPLPVLPIGPAPVSDKLNHFGGYALLALPVALARPRGWALVLVGLVAWSGGIELVQPLVDRQREWADLAANAGGIGIGAVTGAVLRRFL